VSARIYTGAEAWGLLDAATPGPWSAEYDAMPTLYITQASEPHQDIATDLDATDADARLMAAAPDLAYTVDQQAATIADQRREIERLTAERNTALADVALWRSLAERRGAEIATLSAGRSEVEHAAVAVAERVAVQRDAALAQAEELTRALRSAQDESQRWRAAVRNAAIKVSAAFHMIDRDFSGPAQDAAHEELDAAIDTLRRELDAEAPRV
jgi:hypothetical protein